MHITSRKMKLLYSMTILGLAVVALHGAPAAALPPPGADPCIGSGNVVDFLDCAAREGGFPAALKTTSVCHRGNVAAATRWLDADATSNHKRLRSHDWMKQIRRAVIAKAATVRAGKTAWDGLRLNRFLLPGSHDAGTFGRPHHQVAGLPAYFAQTHTYSILDQLCMGSRWFDVRLTLKKNGDPANLDHWRIDHGGFLFNTAAETLEQFRLFIEDGSHRHEVVFIRFKTSGKGRAASAPDARDTLLQAWENALRSYIVSNRNRVATPAAAVVGGMTMGQIRNARASKGASVFLLDYVTDKKRGKVAQLDGRGPTQHVRRLTDALKAKFWDYTVIQRGTFSNKIPLRDIQRLQQQKLTEWKGAPADTVFGLWWTSTGKVGNLNVRTNSRALWRRDAGAETALERFVKDNACEIGNLLIVDFYGDHTVSRHGVGENLFLDLAKAGTLAKIGVRDHFWCAVGD